MDGWMDWCIFGLVDVRTDGWIAKKLGINQTYPDTHVNIWIDT